MFKLTINIILSFFLFISCTKKPNKETNDINIKNDSNLKPINEIIDSLRLKNLNTNSYQMYLNENYLNSRNEFTIQNGNYLFTNLVDTLGVKIIKKVNLLDSVTSGITYIVNQKEIKSDAISNVSHERFDLYNYKDVNNFNFTHDLKGLYLIKSNMGQMLIFQYFNSEIKKGVTCFLVYNLSTNKSYIGAGYFLDIGDFYLNTDSVLSLHLIERYVYKINNDTVTSHGQFVLYDISFATKTRKKKIAEIRTDSFHNKSESDSFYEEYYKFVPIIDSSINL